ncbi:MAG: TerB family tellurite resistance protein [Rubrobacter sp.]|nr:TerB family tellurite resistance protein [Rubrobacter sp.]
MSEREPKTGKIKAQVSEGLDEAREFARTLDIEQVRSGQRFVELLQKVVYAYDRNARTEYFQQKYPGLSPDEIADILISVTARYATVAGGVAGAAATSTQLTTLSSFGMTAPLFFGVIGAEMLYLARIQMRLVLDLSVVYDLQLDPEDPEDVLMVFGYAVGVAPTELLGTVASKAAGGGAKTLVKKYVSKSVLKTIQSFARKLGFTILQRTIIKYTVPVASAIVGSTYNYATTSSMGRIAKAHFRNRGKFTGELQTLVSRQNTYDLVFPAAAMYMAHLDGELSPKERDLYRAMLSRMTFSEHAEAEFRRLVDDEANLIEAAARIEDMELRRSLMDVLALMAVCDGELAEKESEFLANIAGRLEVTLNPDEVEKRTRDYRVTVKQSMAGKAADAIRNTTTATGRRAKGALGKVLKRRTISTSDREPDES